MNLLTNVPEKFHTPTFHKWMVNDTPIHSLQDKAQGMHWHQGLINLAPNSIQEEHKHVDGVSNISKFKFDDFTKYST